MSGHRAVPAMPLQCTSAPGTLGLCDPADKGSASTSPISEVRHGFQIFALEGPTALSLGSQSPGKQCLCWVTVAL